MEEAHKKHTRYYCSECKLLVVMIPEQEPIKGCKCKAAIIAEISGTVVRNTSNVGVN